MSKPERIVIVGGVAGGASAAARARRLSEDAEIILFERGEYISFANCGLPYHIGGSISKREQLLIQTPQSMDMRFQIDVRVKQEVVEIDRQNREVIVLNRVNGNQYRERFDALILSPGASPVRPSISGIESPRVLCLRNIDDMDAILQAMVTSKEKRAAVIGGGYIGLEMAEAFRNKGLEVTLIELADQVMAAADPELASLLHQELRNQGVDLRLNTSVTKFVEADNRLTLSLNRGEGLRCGLAVVAIGVKPEIQLAQKAGLNIGEKNGIVVDEHMRTSDPNIYAVGDVVEVTDYISGAASLVPLAGPANRQGRIAADNIFGRNSSYKNTQGTAICKVFNLTIGMTGICEKALLKHSIRYEKVYLHPADHATYYPGSSQIYLKLMFDPTDGKILGAQAVGKAGVDKRIDVLAIALRAGMTVYDLEDAELSYAPPYGSAKDPVNYAGFIAANVIKGDARICHIDDILHLSEQQVLLDVRTPKEIAKGQIPNSISIPIDDLRYRMEELPRDKEILIYCQVGLRSYLAYRILSQCGYSCRCLSGGYQTYLAWH